MITDKKEYQKYTKDQEIHDLKNIISGLEIKIEQLEKQLRIGGVVGQSEQYTCECKVCGKPFENNEDYYKHYDEEHN